MGYTLKHSLCSVERPGGGLTRGGCQSLSGNKNISLAGCGIVGAAELLIYLSRHHGCLCPELLRDIPFRDSVTAGEYDVLLRKISSRYLPIIPRSGINGVELAAGVNLIFRKYSIPFKARWGVGTRTLYPDIESMLQDDIPVIISVGPNLPLFWGKEKVDLFSLTSDGTLRKTAAINSHYMIVTGLDEQNIRVSSWGQEYYIKRDEYDSYVRNHSNSIVCNILHIERKN